MARAVCFERIPGACRSPTGAYSRSSSTIRAALSPIMIESALVLPEVSVGMGMSAIGRGREVDS